MEPSATDPQASGQSSASSTPATPPAAASPAPSAPAVSAVGATPVVTSGGDSGPATTSVATGPTMGSFDVPAGASGSGGGRKKTLLLGVIIAVLLIGGASAYYFGYYMNPSLIYSQSLSNTGKGYEKLVDYLDTQSQAQYKGFTGSGTYTFGAGSVATDGKLAFRNDGDSADATFDLNIGASRLGFEARTVKSATPAKPDIYFKASGLSGLGSLLGSDPQVSSVISKVDDHWIMVDQSLIDSLQQSATSQVPGAGSQVKSPSHAQVLDEVHAFDKVNDQYVFTADKNKAITTVVKKFGSETVDGHKTYHYQVMLNKANVKQYITAQRDALKASQLYGWLKQNKYDNYVDLAYDSLEQSADNIKSSDTFNIWADVGHRVIYKIRFADPKKPADSYVDFGLNYTGSNEYPFFISGQDKSGSDVTTGLLTLTLNTKTNGTELVANLKGTGSSSFNFNAKLNGQPTNTVTPITAPTGAKPLTQVLNELGLTPLLNELLQGGNPFGLGASGSGTTPSDVTQFQ